MEFTEEMWNVWMKECDHAELTDGARFHAVMKKGIRLHLKDKFGPTSIANIMAIFQIPSDDLIGQIYEWTNRKRIGTRIWNLYPEFRKVFVEADAFGELEYLALKYKFDPVQEIDAMFVRWAKWLAVDGEKFYPSLYKGSVEDNFDYDKSITFFMRTPLDLLLLKAGLIGERCVENDNLDYLKHDLETNMDFSGPTRSRFFSDLFFDATSILANGVPNYLKNTVYKAVDASIEASKLANNMSTIWL